MSGGRAFLSNATVASAAPAARCPPASALSAKARRWWSTCRGSSNDRPASEALLHASQTQGGVGNSHIWIRAA